MTRQEADYRTLAPTATRDAGKDFTDAKGRRSGRPNWSTRLAAVEVFPHSEQLVDISAAEGLLDWLRVIVHDVKLGSEV